MPSPVDYGKSLGCIMEVMQTVIGKLMRSAPALSLVTNFIVDGVIK